MNITVLDAATLGDDIDLSVFDKMGKASVFSSTLPQEVEERIRCADVVVLNKVKLCEDNLKLAERLKLICITATGFDNVDIAYCRERGIAVCNVKGYSTHSVAQVTISMVLSLVTHLSQYNDFVKSGEYTASGVKNRLVPVYNEIYGKTWGVVGLGNIGSQVANVAKALGCRVIANKQTPVKDPVCVGIDELCRESDIITVHTPLNDGTRNLINRERIGMMKKTAVLVNVSRGAVCDERALCDAVEAGSIGGLGIDVYSKEPMGADSPYNKIMHLPNVCLTPHMAWGAYESRMRCIEEVALNIRAFFNGEMRNRV